MAQENLPDGFYEVFTNLEAEETLEKCDCDKNPGHRVFTYLSDLTVDLLKCDEITHTHNELLELVKLQADLTVCLKVNFTSSKRPDKLPGIDLAYPFADVRGKKNGRTGTGWICGMLIYKGNKPCPCTSCKTPGQARDDWAMLTVRTATHLVFDQEEGKQTKCLVFYDRPNDEGIISLTEVSGVSSIVEGDWTKVIFVTHDCIDEMTRLSKKLNDYKSLWRKVRTAFTPTQPGQSTNESYDPSNPLTVIVSHPHGCCKHISIGKVTRCEPVQLQTHNTVGNYTQYSYTAATCKGSSGAYVYVLGRTRWDLLFCHTHRGISLNDVPYQENISSIGHG